ncbi:MAG: DUF1648 domain-containing protein [Dehalococcoidales bacterium]|nr:DUF1648 domain-containing protein [Dehalococcoidales bacterium]
MNTIISILAVVLIIGLVSGGVTWFVGRRGQAARRKEVARKVATRQPITFRWRYTALPVTILLLSLVITAYFYHLLPSELAYHFRNGAPDKWLSRGATIAWLLTPQFLFTLLAGAIVWGIARLSAYFPPATGQRVEKMLPLMGNMIALPQVILGFAIFDIFSYNTYQIHLMSLWAFALVVMGVGGVILGISFIFAVRRLWTKGSPTGSVEERQ